MKELHDILPGFKTLREYSEFMEHLAEKDTSGQEIARGMDKNDKSKQQKSDTFVSKEVEKKANGASTETHYDQADPSMGAGTDEPPPAQPLPPGSQVNVGNKAPNTDMLGPKTSEVDISGDKDQINMKPQLKKDPNKGL